MSEPVTESGDTEAEHPAEPVARSREPVFNLSGVILFLMAVCLGVQLLRLYVLDPGQDLAFMLRAAFIPARYSGQYTLDLYAFTSPITYAFLHGGWAHLLINMVWLAAFGSPLANRLGTARLLAFWVFTSLAAVLFHYLAHPMGAMPVVGASGAISGMMGAASRFGFRIERHDGKPAFAGEMLSVGNALRRRAVLTFLAVWMVVNLVTGLGFMTPGIDSPIAWEAHIGGFLAGFLLLAPFVRPSLPPPPDADAQA